MMIKVSASSLLSVAIVAGSYMPARPAMAMSVVSTVVMRCITTPLRTTLFPRRDLGGIPWIAAIPTASGITAHLFYRYPGMHGDAAELHVGGKMPDGGNTKVLWVIDNPRVMVLGPLVIVGRNLTGRGVFRQIVPPALSATDFPSILTVPSAGCWRLQLTSKSLTATGAIVAASVVMRVVA